MIYFLFESLFFSFATKLSSKDPDPNKDTDRAGSVINWYGSVIQDYGPVRNISTTLVLTVIINILSFKKVENMFRNRMTRWRQRWERWTWVPCHRPQTSPSSRDSTSWMLLPGRTDVRLLLTVDSSEWLYFFLIYLRYFSDLWAFFLATSAALDVSTTSGRASFCNGRGINWCFNWFSINFNKMIFHKVLISVLDSWSKVVKRKLQVSVQQLVSRAYKIKSEPTIFIGACTINSVTVRCV